MPRESHRRVCRFCAEARIGDFVAWILADVEKESAAELEAAGLTWKKVNWAVASAARAWFQARVRDA